LYGRKTTLLWIEPGTNDAKERLSPRIREYLAKRLPSFFGRASGDPVASAEYVLLNPLKVATIPTRVVVERFHRI